VVHDDAEADDLLPGEARHRCPHLLRQLGGGVADPSDRRLGTELGDEVGFEAVSSSIDDLTGHVGGRDDVLE
jgi:hypothetical protein